MVYQKITSSLELLTFIKTLTYHAYKCQFKVFLMVSTKNVNICVTDYRMTTTFISVNISISSKPLD